MKSGDKDAIVKELEQPVQALRRRSRAENHTADAKQKCANTTAALATETAMAWHLEAVGSQGQRGTGDPQDDGPRGAPLQEGRRDLERRRVLEVRVPAPRQGGLAERSTRSNTTWPTSSTSARGGPSAARRSTRSCRRTRRRPRRAEAAYAAVLCYQNIYLAHAREGRRQEGQRQPARASATRHQAGRRTTSTSPKEMTDAQKAMVAVLQPVRLLHPPGQERRRRAEAARRGEVRPRAACTSRRSTGRRRRPASRTSRTNHSDNDSAIYAAQLYLESINVLTFHGTPNRERRASTT